MYYCQTCGKQHELVSALCDVCPRGPYVLHPYVSKEIWPDGGEREVTLWVNHRCLRDLAREREILSKAREMPLQGRDTGQNDREHVF